VQVYLGGEPCDYVVLFEIRDTRREHSRAPYAEQGLTARGRVLISELETARGIGTLAGVLEFAGSAGNFAPASKLLSIPGVVALSSPVGAPPAGTFGVWSDQQHHAYIAAYAPVGGRLLFVDVNGETITTDFLTQLIMLSSREEGSSTTESATIAGAHR
jgi:hypothetical protein